MSSKSYSSFFDVLNQDLSAEFTYKLSGIRHLVVENADQTCSDHLQIIIKHTNLVMQNENIRKSAQNNLCRPYGSTAGVTILQYSQKSCVLAKSGRY